MFFNWKKGLSAALAAGLCLGGGARTVYAEEAGGTMGRYVEQEMETPDLKIRDIVTLSDGTLRLIGENDSEGTGTVSDVVYEMWDSADGGQSWEKAVTLSEETKGAYFTDLVLAPDGSAAAREYRMLEDGTGDGYEYLYYDIGADGSAAEIPVTEDIGSVWHLCMSGQGDLIALTNANSAVRINRKSGEIEQTYAGTGEYLSFVGTCGPELLLFSGTDVQRYDIATGEPLPFDESLNEQMFSGGQSYEITMTNAFPIVFGGTDDERMYYCTDQGIFGHVPGGTVVEQIVDGGMSSLSGPRVSLVAMTVAEKDFYVILLEDMETKLVKFSWSADTPTVPEREVRVYSLNENEEVRQMAMLYQKEHPDVLIRYEAGLTGEDGMTASDALRTLNTDIMAGNGPDVLVLDGMPVRSYMEKGVLADISDIRGMAVESGSMLKSMASVWEKDGAVYALPIRFRMPVLAGSPGLIEKAEDLVQLADVVEALPEGDPGLEEYNIFFPAEYLYFVCAGAWRNEDNTVDEEKLLEYITQVKRIRDSRIGWVDSVFLDAYQQYKDLGEDRTAYLGMDMMGLIGDDRLGFGEFDSVLNLNFVASIRKDYGAIAYRPLNGQQSNVFVPSGVLGISSTSQYPEDARAFVEYAFGEEAQSQSMGGGFPVSRDVLQKLLHEKEPGESGGETFTSSRSDGSEEVSLNITWMSEEDMDQFLEYVDSLDTPADMDAVLKEAVIAQARECIDGNCTPEEAVSAVMQTVNLYLAEG